MAMKDIMLEIVSSVSLHDFQGQYADLLHDLKYPIKPRGVFKTVSNNNDGRATKSHGFIVRLTILTQIQWSHGKA